MSKYPQDNSEQPNKKVRFLEFWLSVAAEVGAHRFDINPQAKRIDQLFNDKNVHAEYVKDVVRSSLPNKHGNLNQTIDLTKLLDTLGETAYNLRQNRADDLFDIEFLEEIGWVIASRYYPQIDYPKGPSKDKIAPRSEPKASVFSLSRYKIKQANRRL